MTRHTWDRERLHPTPDDDLWEVFHENSKLSRWDPRPPNEYVVARMQGMSESLCYDGYPVVELTRALNPLTMPLDEAIVGRVTARPLQPCAIRSDDLSALLHNAYGRTRANEDTEWPRPFRVVPSAGATYPLEIYAHLAQVDGVAPGLHHFDPTANCLRRLREGDARPTIADALVQPDLALGSSVIFFLTAVFERVSFKYGNRGYRFALIEAGHVAQNINLVCTALGLGCVNIGGFWDRQIDEFLEIDGVDHSTLYMVAVGAPGH